MVSRLDILAALIGREAHLGALDRLPAPVRAVATAPMLPLAPLTGPGAALGAALAERLIDNPVGKAYSGGSQVIAEKNPILGMVLAPVPTLARLTPGGREMAADAEAAFDAGDGTLWARLRAANEAGASRHPIAQGALNAAEDPLNLLGPLAKPLQATKAARLGRVLAAVDRAQSLPIEALAGAAKVTGNATARRVLASRLTPVVEQTTGKAGSIPEHLLPLVGGARQFGPIPPPPLGGLTRSARGNVPRPELIPGIGGDGGTGIGPLLPPLHGPVEPPVYGPLDIPAIRGNVPRPELIPGIGEGGKPGLGPVLPPSQDVPLPQNALPARLLDRVEAAMRGRPPVSPPVPAPARGPLPRPKSREERLAAALAGRFPQPEPVAEALPAPARLPVRPRLVAEREPADLGAIIAGRFGPPPGAVTRAEERAARELGPLQDVAREVPAPDFPAFDGFSGPELDRLVELAYPHERALDNAIAKHGADDGLAAAAVARIRADRGLLARLAREDDALARKLAFWEPAEAAPVAAPAARSAAEAARVTPDTPAAAQATTAGREAFDALIATRDDGKMGAYLPGAAFFAKRLGIPVAEAQGYIDDLAARGVVGDAGGALAFRPGPQAADLATPARDRAAKATGATYPDISGPPVNYADARERINRLERAISAGEMRLRSRVDALGKRLSPEALEEVQRSVDDTRAQLARLREIAPWAFAGDIAAGGGGGGGLGVVPYPGGLSGAVGRAVLPAAASGLAGAGVGAAAGAIADDEDRLGGALQGGLIGAGLGYAAGGGASLAGLKAPEYLAPLLRQSWDAGVAAWREAGERSTGSLVSALRNLPTTWRINVTHHPRNLIGDEAWGRLVLRGGQGPEASRLLGEVRADLIARRGAATPWEREPQQVRDIQRFLGRDGQVPVLGDSMAQAERRLLSVTDTTFGEFALSAFNPAAFATNAAGLAFAGVKGALRPALRGFFKAFNGFQQATFRRAAYADEAGAGLRVAAETFLPRLRAAGVDVAGLAPDGRFTAAEVRALAGNRFGDDWARLADTVREAAESRVRFLFGDYGRLTGLERLLGGVVPFVSWLVRAYPTGIALLAQHPAVALGLYHYLQATRPAEGSGRPAYTAGMVPLATDMPVIGAILDAYTGGAGGTVYLDPLGAVTPFGGELVRPAERETGQNLYQRAAAWLDRTGLPGFNPAIQEVAYLTGLDYKQPGNLSRTAGIEQGLALLPGNPPLPDVGAAANAALRGGISRAAEGVIPGARADATPERYDPITRRYAELVIQETGKPLADPANRAYLAALADPENPLLQRARAEVLLGGAFKNAASLTAPVGLVAQTDPNRAYRAAAAGLPFTADRIQAARPVSPLLADLMTGANERYAASHPAAATYRVASREDAAWEQVRQWEAANRDFAFVVGPAIYNRERRKLLVRLGLAEPPREPATTR